MNKTELQLGLDIEFMPRRLMESNDPIMWRDYDQALRSLGTKQRPTSTSQGVYHNDACMVEIAPPAYTTARELFQATMALKERVETLLGMGMLAGYEYITLPTDMEQYAPYVFEESRVLGCAPDMSGGETRVLPEWVRQRSINEVGLHTHQDVHPEMRGIDPYIMYHVGRYQEVAASYHAPWNADERPWYRQPGTYRIKPYGVEYRSLGSSICNNPDNFRDFLGMTFTFMHDMYDECEQIVQEAA